MSKTKKSIPWMGIFGIVINIFLLVEVVVLVVQNRDLRSQIEELTVKHEPLKQGEQVTGFEAKSIDGANYAIRYGNDEKKYLFLLLSTTCSICETNLPNWNSLVSEINDPNLVVLGLSIDDEKKISTYLSKHTVGFNVGIVSDTSFSRRYKVIGFPQTVLISGNGKVIQTWEGTLVPERLQEVKQYLTTSRG